MRLRWVGDARDYVKWDCVFEHAEGRFVFYLPMLRSASEPRCRHPQVQEHFDRQKELDQFAGLFPGRFAVFKSPHEEYSTRIASSYFLHAARELKAVQLSHSVLVFIDPDTGVEPAGGAKDEHLRIADLRMTWNALQVGDRLIVYQHASRSTDWRRRLKNRVAECLNIEIASEPYFNTELAKDVCFLVLEKSEQ